MAAATTLKLSNGATATTSAGGKSYIGTIATRDALVTAFGAGSVFNEGGKTYFRGTIANPAPAAGAGTGTGSTAANTTINANQDADMGSSNAVTLRESVNSAAQSFLDGLTTNQAPAPYSALDTYKNLIGDPSATNPDGLGITTLETTLNGLNQQEIGLKTTASARSAANLDTPVAMGVIGGRQSEIDRQTNTALNDLALQKAPIVSALNGKYQLVGTLMNLMQTDYTNATNYYNTQFDHQVAAINLMNGIATSAESAEASARTSASANLAIIANAITDGNLDYNSLPAADQANITKWETTAGLPAGFMKNLHSSNPTSTVISMSERTEGTTKYQDVVLRDNKTGKISVQHVVLGTVSKTTTSSGSGSGSSTKKTTTSAATSKTLTDFSESLSSPGSLVSNRKIAANGEDKSNPSQYVSRETLIAALKKKYPDIEPADIEIAVYTTYKDSTGKTTAQITAEINKKYGR